MSVAYMRGSRIFCQGGESRPYCQKTAPAFFCLYLILQFYSGLSMVDFKGNFFSKVSWRVKHFPGGPTLSLGPMLISIYEPRSDRRFRNYDVFTPEMKF